MSDILDQRHSNSKRLKNIPGTVKKEGKRTRESEAESQEDGNLCSGGDPCGVKALMQGGRHTRKPSSGGKEVPETAFHVF
jgi:hypothetical protein